MELEKRLNTIFKREPKANCLMIEEVKAIKLYIWLFYIIYFTFDLFFYFIIPHFKGAPMGHSEGSFGFGFYLILGALLPISIYLIRNNMPYVVKYLYFIVYTITDITESLIMFYGTGKEFSGGNIVEVFLVFITAIFINKTYFWFVSLATIVKYSLLGIILETIQVALPLVIFFALAGISYLLLARFYSYINTVEKINQELRDKEKLALVGQLATSIGHEIKNPLSSLKGFTQLQKEKYPQDHEYFKIMISEIDRINSIVNDLMYIGKPKVSEFKENNIKEIIEYVERMHTQFAKNVNVKIFNNIDNDIFIVCDENQLKQVFINILKNAVESMPDGGYIKLAAQIIEDKKLLISIEDEGLGIEKEKLAMLGQPFYTTKTDGNGLGLMVTHNIIEKHNGKIIYISEPGKGTRVEVYLPI